MNWPDFVGPGTIKAGLKAVNHLTGGALQGPVEALEEMTSSPAYTKYRIDHARDKANDFWDDHKEDVTEFFDNVGEHISNGLETASDFISDGVAAIGGFLGDLL